MLLVIKERGDKMTELEKLKEEKQQLIEWLETLAEFNTDTDTIEHIINRVLDKIRELEKEVL